jgi:hypothetical protein
MASEALTLDGLPLTSGGFVMTALDMTPPSQRQTWITAADSEAAALFRQPLHENRTVTLKLRVTPQASMDAALDRVGALVDKLRKAASSPSGIALVWTPNDSARACTFTVLTGEISGMPIGLADEGYSWVLRQPIVTVTLTCQPYAVGVETLTGTSSSSTPFLAFEVTGVTGDVPALGRAIVTDTATQSRRHVELGVEGPATYNASTSLIVDSDNMVVTGFSGVQAVTTGAYDPNAAGNNSITLSPIAGATTAMAGTGDPLSHVGVFRVKARVQSASLGNLFRLSWKAGDGPTNHNTWATPISVSGWIELDLGTITVPATTLGTQRWTGQIEVQGAASTPGTVALDYLILVPQADGYGKARAQWSLGTGTLASYDAFAATTAGLSLNARTAPLGGVWATSGAATDFQFSDLAFTTAIQENVTRTAAGTRLGTLGTATPTDVQVSAMFVTTSRQAGVIARFVDSSNYAYALLDASGLPGLLAIKTVIAGVTTTLASVIADSTFGFSTGDLTRLIFVVFASGRAIAIAENLDAGGRVVAQVEATSSALLTAGTLASGKSGIVDVTAGAGGQLWISDFAVSTPPAEPIALYSGRSLQWRYDATLRQDSTGTYYGQTPSYRGSRLLLQPGTSRVLVKARRNDIETALDDQVTDALQAQVGWTPRYLVIPR